MNHRQKKIPFNEGNKGHISNKIADDETLSCEAFRLLFLLLNNASTWEVNLGYYSRKYGWTERKQSKIRKELEDKGYLTMKGTGKGRGNGKEYIFTISEYGDLKGQPSTPQEPVEDPITPTPEPEPSQPEAALTMTPIVRMQYEAILERSVIRNQPTQQKGKLRTLLMDRYVSMGVDMAPDQFEKWGVDELSIILHNIK